jgi:hypothetical protein
MVRPACYKEETPRGVERTESLHTVARREILSKPARCREAPVCDKTACSSKDVSVVERMLV